MAYRVFKRAWWRREASGRLVPNSGGRRTTLCYVDTEAEARAYCRRWNEDAPDCWRSIKAEYTGGG